MPADLGRVAVTGASGFVGRALTAQVGSCEPVALGAADWRERIGAANLRDALVFHLAARVHRPGDDDEAAYERDNAEKTWVLADAAAAQGARRFVFLSSIKVNGEETRDRAFRPGDPEAPQDAYARSKAAAEHSLAEVATRTGLAVMIVRAPLVVGPGARGNLLSLLRIADSPWPLPFAALDNRRTMIQVDDLASLLIRCGLSERAPGSTVLAGDPKALSTSRLVASIRTALGRPARMFALPVPVLEAGAAMIGCAAAMRRLTRNLEIDVAATMDALEWAPRTGIAAGIEQMALAYRATGVR